MRQSTPKRVRSIVLYGVAVPLIVVPALGVLGTFAHDVPYVGLAAAFVPWFLSWLVVAAVLGGTLTAVRCTRSRVAAVLTAVAILAAAGGVVATWRMVGAVERAGADISLVETFGLGSPRTAEPDDVATYTTFDGEPLQLSIFRPAASGPTPVLVFIHGGGWVAGDRDAHSADLRWFADQGWLAVSIDYPLSSTDRHTWDVASAQVGCALTWLSGNAARYGGDIGRLSLTGDSAGGNLAINAAYQAATGALPSSCPGRVPRVAAVSALYPAVDPAGMHASDDAALGDTARGMVESYTGGTPQQYPRRYARISSLTHISRAAPPTLVILPEADHLVPTAGTYRFTEAARSAGVDIELVTVPYADHVFDARPGSIGQQAYRQLTANWLHQHGQGP
ncbi:alpha/beta hydrolase [Mycobacterium deserti]|uniref:Alpha/beta hydrolase n=1 Tax=Mycobacterium deserti TaxID=2978347 RepID=A0ABT2MGL4_9MYCO|nr:alpha/beta hydrolase [Mycobacterium deserti]MCT7661430.1 alpha/beta hydrolase [Mycobacterium deserti]